MMKVEFPVPSSARYTTRLSSSEMHGSVAVIHVTCSRRQMRLSVLQQRGRRQPDGRDAAACAPPYAGFRLPQEVRYCARRERAG